MEHTFNYVTYNHTVKSYLDDKYVCQIGEVLLLVDDKGKETECYVSGRSENTLVVRGLDYTTHFCRYLSIEDRTYFIRDVRIKTGDRLKVVAANERFPIGTLLEKTGTRNGRFLYKTLDGKEEGVHVDTRDLRPVVEIDSVYGERLTIKKACELGLKVGDRILTNASGYDVCAGAVGQAGFVGTVRCIHESGMICVQRDDGKKGTGCARDWIIRKDNPEAFIIVFAGDKETTNTATNDKTMTNETINNAIEVKQFIEREGLSDIDRVLLEAGLENPSGNPTPEGQDALQKLIWKEYRSKLAEKATAVLEAKKGKKKEAKS